jgi:hypothetical protein
MRKGSRTAPPESKRFFSTIFLDHRSTPSFGRVVAVPFLLSSWAIGTALGAFQIYQGKDATDTLWMLAGVAFAFYTGSKGIGVMERGVGSRKQSQSYGYGDGGYSSTAYRAEAGEYDGEYEGEEGEYEEVADRTPPRAAGSRPVPSTTRAAPAWDGRSPPVQGPMVGD